MITKKLGCLAALLASAVLMLGGCDAVWNSPYPADERDKLFLHEEFNSRPKHFDPVQSYVEDEAWFTYSIYETLFEFHYLKRPFELQPGLAAAMPKVSYLDKQGQPLPADAPAAQIAQSVYEIPLKAGVRFQPHPALARDGAGRLRYEGLDDAKLGGRTQITDFEFTGTRELVSEDFAYGIKRIARPKLESPSLELFKQILGFDELIAQLEADVKAGKADPDGWIDLRKYPLAGVETPDPHTLRIRLKGKYPQFIYWLAMPFSAPMPWEAEKFYAQPGMAKRELTLDMWPIGTGPFMLTRNRPLREILMERNPNFREQTYPCEGAPGDKERGLLDDCGKRLPMIDGVKFVYEKEATPFWNKFLQGYYDFYASTRFKTMASFDTALQMQGGGLSLSDAMKKQGIALKTEIEPATEYFFVNMLDPLIGDGGVTPKARERARKVRQAMAIAFDMEEYLSIMKNGLGIPMQGPIPPGIAGYKTGEAGINPYAFTWKNGRPKLRSIDEAKRLLAEAGYPNGRDVDTGEPLVINLDVYDVFKREQLEIVIKQMKRIDIQLVPRLTEWNRWQEMHRKGAAQLSFWGWNADYPDPENFLFLFYSKNSKAKFQGENVTNYNNPEFDKLFEQFRGMDVTADRQPIIDKMADLVRRDAPVLAGWHNEAFELSHSWLRNSMPVRMLHTNRKYLSLDVAKRNALSAQWNRPQLWPLVLVLAAIAALAALGVRHYRRHETQTARSEAAQ